MAESAHLHSPRAAHREPISTRSCTSARRAGVPVQKPLVEKTELPSARVQSCLYPTWSWAAQPSLALPCSLDLSFWQLPAGVPRLPGGLLGKCPGCLGSGEAPGHGFERGAGSRGDVTITVCPAFVSPSFGPVLLFSRCPCALLRWLGHQSPPQKVAELDLGHVRLAFKHPEGCGGGDEDTEVQSGPTAQTR